MRSIIGDEEIEVFLSPFLKLADASEQWFIRNGTCVHCRKKYIDIKTICLCCEFPIVSIPIEFYEEYQKVSSLESNRSKNFYRKKRRIENIENAEGFYNKEDIDEIFKIQNGQCYYCKTELKDSKKQKYFEIDHIFPLALGGDQWPTNLALACCRCNRKKGYGDEDNLWRYLRKEIGIKAVNASKQINQTHHELKLALIKKRE